MEDAGKTKEQLIDELAELRQRIAELGASEVEHERHERAERSLRERERRYRILVENITEAIFTLDEDWNFTFLSPGFGEIIGYHIQDLMWYPFVEILAPEYSETILDRFGTNAPYEVEFVHRNGRKIPVELSLIPILNDEEQPTGVILGAVRDLSKRKQAMGELLLAQKLESVGLLAGGIAHDFNNVLTVILGNISLARIYTEAEEAANKVLEKLTVAEEASSQARILTQRLLTFARGGAPIKEVTFIEELLRASSSFALSGSNVRCEFSIPEELWPVEIDEGQIRQVISNIVINADQAIPEGGIVKVRAENVAVGVAHGLPLQSGAYVRVSIEDQGTGISQEDLQKIFDPYFTTKEGSSGLGLASSYSIVKKHNGHITAESQLGAGTVFHIYLPASPEEALAEEAEEEEEEVKEETAMGKGSILVMDDDASIRDLVDEVLSNHGYRVTTAANGVEAIKLYQEARATEHAYDAVILDLTIPGGWGGKETIRKLMEIDSEVKAIVSSGYSKDLIMSDFRDYGFKGVIAKPYEIEELSNVLHKVLTGD